MNKIKTPWGQEKMALTYKGEEQRQWVRKSAYGGLLAENITQATARDLLVNGMFNWERAGYPIVMHVHDELVSEVRLDSGRNVKEAENLMCQLPPWAAGLPIAAEGWEGERYRK